MNGKGVGLNKGNLLQIAREIYRVKTPTELAKELGVSVAMVYDVSNRMRKAGFDIPKRGSAYAVTIGILKQEHPELLAKSISAKRVA